MKQQSIEFFPIFVGQIPSYHSRFSRVKHASSGIIPSKGSWGRELKNHTNNFAYGAFQDKKMVGFVKGYEDRGNAYIAHL